MNIPPFHLGWCLPRQAASCTSPLTTSIFPKCVRVSFLGWPGQQKRRSGGFAIAGERGAASSPNPLFLIAAVACLCPDSFWCLRTGYLGNHTVSGWYLSLQGSAVQLFVRCLYLRTDGDSLNRRCMQLHYGSQFLSWKLPSSTVRCTTRHRIGMCE